MSFLGGYSFPEAVKMIGKEVDRVLDARKPERKRFIYVTDTHGVTHFLNPEKIIHSRVYVNPQAETEWCVEIALHHGGGSVSSYYTSRFHIDGGEYLKLAEQLMGE